jgi:hypothetical protein
LLLIVVIKYAAEKTGFLPVQIIKLHFYVKVKIQRRLDVCFKAFRIHTVVCNKEYISQMICV